MCGIFGIVVNRASSHSLSTIKHTMDNLFALSESRGKEASGVALCTNEDIFVAKYPIPASQMIRTPEYEKIYRIAFNQTNFEFGSNSHSMSIFGHSRLVTNGGQQIHNNNQPAVSNGIVAIHNGIVTNVDKVWDEYPEFEQKTDLDTEILLHLTRKYYLESGSIVIGVQKCFGVIEGVASIAMFFEDLNNILLATNNGSLYIAYDQKKHVYIFASEKFILKTLIDYQKLNFASHDFQINQVKPGTGIFINLVDFIFHAFSLFPTGNNINFKESTLSLSKKIYDISPHEEIAAKQVKIPGDGPYVLSPNFVDQYPRNSEAISLSQRCTKCVLPETMPFIEFDGQGVCNYCRNYQPIGFLGEDALEQVLENHRKLNGDPDCLITFSGGRDSSYSVHLLKTKFNMNPITYTYDWGMVTDLARRNQMRICGKLGIEHILLSADIAKKRKNIQRNVLAWLKRPDLGTVPIFMAGDKQYFYHMNKISKQINSNLIILGENLLETTQFKYGFCGIPPSHGNRHTYTLNILNKFKLAIYYGSRYVINPAYLNPSLLDTLGAFGSYYVIPHDYTNIYEFIKWDENEINSTLIDEYNWEIASDTNSTWRIGDGTAAFYNYVYYTMAGLTENDTFRSNQIREGMISREQAIDLITTDNQPRYESIQWYCDIIGIDFYSTINKINSAKKLYQT